MTRPSVKIRRWGNKSEVVASGSRYGENTSYMVCVRGREKDGNPRTTVTRQREKLIRDETQRVRQKVGQLKVMY